MKVLNSNKLIKNILPLLKSWTKCYTKRSGYIKTYAFEKLAPQGKINLMLITDSNSLQIELDYPELLPLYMIPYVYKNNRCIYVRTYNAFQPNILITKIIKEINLL